MNRNEIYDKIKDVFDEFFDGEVEISKETTMENCSEWESIAHIQLMFEIEEKFDIQFEADRIAEMISIEKIIDEIKRVV